jgi:hypothetical protein
MTIVVMGIPTMYIQECLNTFSILISRWVQAIVPPFSGLKRLASGGFRKFSCFSQRPLSSAVAHTSRFFEVSRVTGQKHLHIVALAGSNLIVTGIEQTRSGNEQSGPHQLQQG